MKKSYTVQFKEVGDQVYEFTFVTENIERSIKDYCKTKPIVEYSIIKEDNVSTREMLFG